MKIRPILFSTEMVKARMDGRKKMTRRICKHQFWSHSELVDVNINKITSKVDKNVTCPYGIVGDVLWVRESWYLATPYGPEDYYYGYKAYDHPIKEASSKYDYCSPDIMKPSIHMPKSACRTWLRITDIRVELLQEINKSDAISEGIESIMTFENNKSVNGGLYKNYMGGDGLVAIESFKSLWLSINGAGSWDANPWVWVISFEECEMPDGFLD